MPPTRYFGQQCKQRLVQVCYKDMVFDHPLRYDIMIDDCLLLELKSVDKVLPIHKAQLMSYMKLLNVPLGILINFNATRLVDGISRLILPGANHDIPVPCS